MNQCFNCMFMHPDWDAEGNVIRPEYCHFDGPEEWAPCYEEEPEEEPDYISEYWADSAAEADYDEEVAYQEWLAEWEREGVLMSEERWVHEFGQPYDYQEF